jgi:hypothetical protein
VERLVAEFDVDPGTAARDVGAFVIELEAHGLLEA